MKIYVDCYLPVSSPAVFKRFIAELLQFEKHLRAAGIEVLDFNTPDLPFDPHRAEVTEFIKFCDAVVALGSPPSLGFSGAVREAGRVFGKPCFLFVPHSTNLQQEFSPQLVSYLFCVPDFPAQILLAHHEGVRQVSHMVA